MAFVILGLGFAPKSGSQELVSLTLLQFLSVPIAAVLLMVQFGCWLRRGTVQQRRWIVRGLAVAALLVFVLSRLPGLEPGRGEAIHAADDIWVDVNTEPAFSVSPDRTWLVYGRRGESSRFRSSHPVDVVARNLITGEERIMIPAGKESYSGAAMAVLRRLDDSAWAADTLVVQGRDSWKLLVPAVGEVIEEPHRARLSLRPSAELFDRIKARFSAQSRCTDLAWDGRSLGGFLYFAERCEDGGRRSRLDRITRDGRRETVKVLKSSAAVWYISDIAVSPNGRWVAMHAIRTPRYSFGYLFFVIPIIGYHGVDHLIVVNTDTGRSSDHGEYERLHSLQWLPDSRHLVYFEDTIRGPVRVEALEFPALDTRPDEPRVAWDGRRANPRGIRIPPSPTVVRNLASETLLPPGWVSLDFGQVGFSYPGDRYRLTGHDSVLVLIRDVDGQERAEYELNLEAHARIDFRGPFKRVSPVPGFGPEAHAGWVSNRNPRDRAVTCTYYLSRGDGTWIRVVRLAAAPDEIGDRVTNRMLASFHVEGRRGY